MREDERAGYKLIWPSPLHILCWILCVAAKSHFRKIALDTPPLRTKSCPRELCTGEFGLPEAEETNLPNKQNIPPTHTPTHPQPEKNTNPHPKQTNPSESSGAGRWQDRPASLSLSGTLQREKVHARVENLLLSAVCRRVHNHSAFPWTPCPRPDAGEVGWLSCEELLYGTRPSRLLVQN